MPKGVEHNIHEFNRAYAQLAKESVMPKGVEHVTIQNVGYDGSLRKNSVMPKGVEHQVGVFTTDGGPHK